MGKAGPKSGLAKRREQIGAAGTLIEEAVGHERNSYELWKSIRKQARVASNGVKTCRVDSEGLPEWGSMSTHQKMKVAQDFLVTAFMTPEIGVRFIEACMQDPIAMGKMAMSIMPKELHVDVEHRSGVVVVPMKAESVEAWLATVEKHDSEKLIEANPEDYWTKTLGDSHAAEGRSDPGSDSDPGTGLHLDATGG